MALSYEAIQYRRRCHHRVQPVTFGAGTPGIGRNSPGVIQNVYTIGPACQPRTLTRSHSFASGMSVKGHLARVSGSSRTPLFTAADRTPASSELAPTSSSATTPETLQDTSGSCHSGSAAATI